MLDTRANCQTKMLIVRASPRACEGECKVQSVVEQMILLSLSSLFFLIMGILVCSAQPISPTMHDPNRIDELRRYYSERLVRIEYRVRDKSAGGREYNIRGNGFLVSPNGLAITARHVLEPLVSGQYERSSSVRIVKAKGQDLVQLNLVDQVDNSPAIRLSALADIATFYVAAPSGAALEHLCVDFDNAAPTTEAKLTTAAWEFVDLRSPEWELVLNEDASIIQPMGPGPLRQQFELTQPFHDSMSGGVVLQADQVVGVISLRVEEDGKPVGYGNYAASLRFATDVGWQRAKRCGPTIANQQDLQAYGSYDSFVTNTSEGNLAIFIPDGRSGKFWSFPSDGNYAVRPKDLMCERSMCNCTGPKPEKTVRIFVNHRHGTDCQNFRSMCLDQVGVRTFYGVQVVPIFTPASQDTRAARPNTWLFRNALFRRNSAGAFARGREGTQSIARRPSRYNGALLFAEKPERNSSKCATQLSPGECSEIWRIRSFDSEFAPNWHGFPRTNIHPKSTLFNSELIENWTVPQLWLNQDAEVKNWILTYKTTTRPSTSVPFSFCTNSEWQGFFVRGFSPERGVITNAVHVFFNTSE